MAALCCQRPQTVTGSSQFQELGYRNGQRQKVTGVPHHVRLSIRQQRSSSPSFRPSASQQDELPAEIRDDPKFVPLKEEEPEFGPPAMLLVGFQKQEVPKIRKYLDNMGAQFVKLIVCEERMLNETLWNCMHVEQSDDLNQVAESAEDFPRACFLSGMTGEVILTIVRTFPKLGLESNAFAALVPLNAQKLLGEVLDEVMGDHERLTKKE